MQIVNPLILSSELAILNSICEVKDYKTFSVYKSDLFPSYYGGNLLLIKEISEKSLTEWELIFETHFEKNVFGHKTFNFVTTVGNPNILRNAKNRGYDCNYISYLSTDSLQLFKVPKGFEIVKIISADLSTDFKKSKKQWGRYLKFIKESQELEWSAKAGFRKQKYITSALNIEWFALRKKKSKKILSSLGVFKYKNMARLQEVVTHPEHRKKGYASLLVRFITNYALSTLKAEQVIVASESLYHSYKMYEKCGFKQEFEILELMKSSPASILNGKGQ